MTACRIRSLSTMQHLDMTCVTDDFGYWSIYCY
jgi:hypothetical protein